MSWKRDPRGVDDGNPRVIVVYAGRFKQTKSIAVDLADCLSRDGLTAELADADAGPIPPPADYEAVVIGFGRHPHSVLDYIVRSREALAAMPAFFLSIGNDDDIGRMSRATGWRPTNSAVFDAIAPDRRRFLKKLGGHVASSTELAIAESGRIRAFASTIGDGVPAPEVVPTMAFPQPRS